MKKWNLIVNPARFSLKHWTRVTIHLIILIMVLAYARSFFTSMFFHPDRYDQGSPAYAGVEYDEVRFPTGDGKTLHGFFMKPNKPPLGTVLHCHGNASNVTTHYTLMLFLVEAGYNVLVFDYRGYGRSQGRYSTPKGIVQDTQAALDYLRTRDDVDSEKIVLFGQSLGGAAATGAMAKDSKLKGIILEGTFTTYRQMAYETALGRILFFLTPFVIPDIGPLKDIPAISPRPILFLHGEDDNLIPHRFSLELYEKAFGKKSLAILKGFHHLQGGEGEPEYQKAILNFLAQNL